MRELGLRDDHVAALIRMASDPALHGAPAGSSEASAPAHAWRALAQLRAAAAVGPLLDVAERMDDDWTLAEIPEAIGHIGDPALPTLAARLADESRPVRADHVVIRSLGEVAKRAPELRSDIVSLLMKRLEKYPTNDFAVNAYIVEALCALDAKEALPLIKDVYLRQRADLTVIHWDQVLDALDPESTE